MAEPLALLTDAARTLIAGARRAVLSTVDARDGRPRSVPVCFVLVGAPADGAPSPAGAAPELWSALDEKPKATADPRRLRRVANLAADPRATILVDRWDEDWSRLAFVELRCVAELVEAGGAGHAGAVEALRAKYPQYGAHRLEERPLLRFIVTGVTAWGLD